MCSDPPTPPTCKQIKTMKEALLELFTPKGGDLQHAALRLGRLPFNIINIKLYSSLDWVFLTPTC